MRYLSVCSGIEAATVAWHPLGWTPAAFAEIERFPSAVLAHRFPDVPNLGDMTTIGDVGPIDLLVGGTPCQSFSVAGLRAGLADPRGGLALVYLLLARRLRPRWIVWENVPGVLSSSGGRDFGAFLGGLAELGYGFAYRVLDAQFFGLAQRRARVFVVGNLGDWRRAAAVLLERSGLRWDPAPRREAREVAPTIPSRSSAGGGLGTDFDLDGGLIAGTVTQASSSGRSYGSSPIPSNLIALALQRGGRLDGETETFVTHTLRADGFDASEDGTGRGTPIVCVDLQQATSPDHRGQSGPLAPTLNQRGDVVAFNARQDPGVSGPIAEQIGAKDTGHGVAVPSGVRRLTPLECERLQGFPDGWTAIPGAKDGPRYKALGNSMAVPVMRWIGKRIASVEARAS